MQTTPHTQHPGSLTDEQLLKNAQRLGYVPPGPPPDHSSTVRIIGYAFIILAVIVLAVALSGCSGTWADNAVSKAVEAESSSTVQPMMLGASAGGSSGMSSRAAERMQKSRGFYQP